MEIQPLDLADDATVSACLAVRENAARVDDPADGPTSARSFRANLAGWPGGPSNEVWYVPDGDGAVAGWYRAEFPDLENVDRAFLRLVINPARRRRGIGTALLRHAAERAAAGSRAVVSDEIIEGSAGEAFALRTGAALGIVEVRRVQDLAKIPVGTVVRLRQEAEVAAAGYSLVRWIGVTPDEWVDQVAQVNAALNDSPRDATVEPTAWTPERIRDRMNARIATSPVVWYTLAATRDDTGEMAALTSVGVDPDVPDWGHQMITAVTRPHRGHRLGLLLKTAMLDWLAQAEPRLERIDTWNAGSNQHMIAINEALGYRVTGRFRSAELAVSSILARTNGS